MSRATIVQVQIAATADSLVAGTPERFIPIPGTGYFTRPSYSPDGLHTQVYFGTFSRAWREEQHLSEEIMNIRGLTLNIGLVFISLLVTFLAVEAVVRVFGIEPAYGYPEGMYVADPDIGYALSPNFNGIYTKPEFKVNVATNSNGLRDIEYSAKEDRDYRILAIGDSFTWGAEGSELKDTFVKLLEAKLNRHDASKNYQVINLGVPGYGTNEAYNSLRLHSPQLLPDMVLLNFYVGNDFLDNVREQPWSVNDKGQLISGTQEAPPVFSLLGLRTFLLSNFHSYRLFEHKALVVFDRVIQKHLLYKAKGFRRHAENYAIDTSEYFGHAVQRTIDLLEKIKAFSDSLKVPLVIAVVPTSYQVDAQLNKLFIHENGLEESKYDFSKPQALIVNWGASRGIPVIDLLPPMRAANEDSSFYWRLNPHFNEAGNQKAAAIIFDHLTTDQRVQGYFE